MIVYFENSNGTKREIGRAPTEQAARKIVQDFLALYNYKSYYTREWKEEGELKIDVGSWSEFFYIKDE